MRDTVDQPCHSPVKINPRGPTACVCAVSEIDRIRWMSMFIPPSTKCVSSIPTGARLFIYQGVLSVLQQHETTLPLGEMRQRRGMSRKRVAAGRKLFAVPAEPTAAREPATHRCSRGASGGKRWRVSPQVVGHARAASYQKQQGEVYRALLQTLSTICFPAPEAVAPALDGHVARVSVAYRR